MNAEIFAGLKTNKRRDFLQEQSKKIPEDKIEAIKKIVSNSYGITIEQLLSKTRQGVIPVARMAAMNIIKENTRLSSTKVGNIFNKNHATVLYAYGQVEILNNTNKHFAKKYLEISKLVQKT